MKKNNLFSTIFFLFFLLAPFSGSSALNLEQGYPQLPGGQNISSESSLPEVFSYIIALLILVSGVVAFISLIWAGFKYVSSSGNPAIIKEARSRIFNSFLGVIILVGSYLVLNTINPQLLIMRVEKTPIETGVVLLTEKGKEALASSALDNIINSGQARYLSYGIRNLKTEIGEDFVVTRYETIQAGQPPIPVDVPAEINFQNFQIKSLGFFYGSQGQDIEIRIFAEPEFSGENHLYNFKGEIDQTTGLNLDNPGDESQLVNNSNFWVIDLDFFNKETELKDKTKVTALRPPLSFKIEIKKSAVYLATADSLEQRYFYNSNKNLTSIKFEDRAKKIKMKNNGQDYLAALYQDRYFSGGLRLFFLEKSVVLSRDNAITVGNLKPLPGLPDNQEESQWQDIAGIDQYGKTGDISSLQVFKLGPLDFSSCREVRLCTKPEFGGYCLSYLQNARIKQISLTPEADGGGFEAALKEIKKTFGQGAENIVSFYFLSPYYLQFPQELPTVSIPKRNQDGEIIKDGSDNVVYEAVNFDFSDKISSFLIDGNCLVVLFENKFNSSAKTWENDTPGSRSQVFTVSQADLSADEIGHCPGWAGIAFWQTIPCASSIAVYPIED